MKQQWLQELHVGLKGHPLALAESCTGGAIAARLTAIPGASDYLLGSVVAYSNRWKESFLGVRAETLQTKGAVSREVVVEMVEGLLKRTEAEYALAVSGIAGPTGGSEDRPVGTVWIALAKRGDVVEAGRMLAHGNRQEIIAWTVDTALTALWRRVIKRETTWNTN